jgi:type IV fimbrial biogenesis protein FimT
MIKTKVGNWKGGMWPKAVNRGFTVIELMIVVVIVAIGVALALPSYEDTMQRRETTSKAESLAAFLAYAQSAAMKKNTEISVQLSYTDTDNWCIGVDESSAGCDCKDNPNLCTVDGVTRILNSADQGRASMTDEYNVDDTLFVFDPIRGTMVTGDFGNLHFFTLQSENTRYELRVDVSVTGRIKVCNFDSSKAVPGFKPC